MMSNQYLTLDQFLRNYNIKLEKDIYELCLDGVKKMESNPDPHHNKAHVEGILYELSLLLNNEKSFQFEDVNFNILIPSICWHDVWKGSHYQTSNIIVFLYRELHDGGGSVSVLKKFLKSKKYNLNTYTKNNIYYCIKKHSRWSQILPKSLDGLFIKTLEARILTDLDTLDGWTERRMQVLIDHYLNGKLEFNKNYIKIAKLWFMYFIVNKKNNKFFFYYSADEFNKRKDSIIRSCIQLWDDKFNYLERTPEIEEALKLSLKEKKVLEELRNLYS